MLTAETHNKILLQYRIILEYHSNYTSSFVAPETSIWLSVDPLADKYPNLSPYNYCANNPIILVDPDGNDLRIFYNKGKDYYDYKGGMETHLNSFVASVIAAYKHDVGNGGGKFLKQSATTPDIIVEIREGFLSQRQSIEGGGTTIFWNPNLGTLTDENVVLSPATIFEHETGHDLLYQTLDNYHDLTEGNDTPYRNEIVSFPNFRQ